MTQQLLIEFDEQASHYFPPETRTDRIFQKEAAKYALSSDLRPIEELRSKSKEYTKAIFDNFKFLLAVLVCHEDLIRRRWMKKTKVQRKAVLLQAWPNMSPTHRPDFDAHLGDTWTSKIKSQDALAWPYINLEDLMRPRSLLIFLNTRGRNLPYNFAHSDLELAPAYKLRKEFLDCRKDNYAMAFVGRKDVETYGEFMSFERDSEVTDSINRGLTVHVDHGIQILSIQYGILNFLVRCCREIIPEKIKTGIEFVPQPQPPHLSDNLDACSSLDIVAREAPYRLPAKVDFQWMRTLVSAKRNQAVDHVWALREDPGYFDDVMRESREHRLELLLDASGHVSPQACDNTLYERVLRLGTKDAYIAVFFWDEISHRITQLHELSKKYTSQVRIGQDLPEEYFELLVETKFFLEAVSLDFIDLVKYTYYASPPLRPYFKRDINSLEDSPDRIDVLSNYELDGKDKSRDRILKLFQYMIEKGSRDYITLHTLLDEFERLMQDDPNGKSYISPLVASHISQLSVISECLYHLHLFQPWAKRIKSTIEERKSQLMANYAKTLLGWHPLLVIKFAGTNLPSLGNPQDGKFHYPVNKRRSRENVNAMRSAEAALDAFWKAADGHWRRYARRMPHGMVKHILGERSLQRTPPWVEPLKGRKVLADVQPLDYIYQPFSGTYHDAGKSITGNFDKLSLGTKMKEKTQGTPTSTENFIIGSDQVAAEHIADPPSTNFTVDKRAHKVFNTLFHSPNSPDQPGEIPWPDFLHAMVSVGFNAEKLQGSSWHFTPCNLDVERSIQFHEPHPGNKLPFTWARRYGRRLARAYGWNSKMFTLALVRLET